MNNCNCYDCKKEIEKLKISNMKLLRISDYLYTIELYDWDYKLGNDYYKRFAPVATLCSSMRKGNYLGRNFDWYYNDAVEFIVKTYPTKGRHASIAIAQGHPSLTRNIVKNEKWNDAYDILPFMTQDGINDAGVVCNINVVPTGDKPITTGTNPGKSRYCSLILVRYILDHASSAAHAIELLKEIDIWSPSNRVMSQEVHFMVADIYNTYVVEFVNNHLIIFSDTDDEYDSIPNDKTIMTNFYYAGWDGNIVTGFDTESGIMPYETTLTPHASGLERYSILSEFYDEINSIEDMKSAMHAVCFTKAYHATMNPFWYSEFVGDFRPSAYGDLTIYQPKRILQTLVDYEINEFNHRQRDGKTWHTKHTSLFDIPNKTMTVYSQEDYNHPFVFSI